MHKNKIINDLIIMSKHLSVLSSMYGRYTNTTDTHIVSIEESIHYQRDYTIECIDITVPSDILYWSIKENLSDVALFLIEKGIDPEYTIYINTSPLVKAVYKGYLNIVEKLYEQGANINCIISDQGGTIYEGNCLVTAIEMNRLKIIEYLLSKNIEIKEVHIDLLLNTGYKKSLEIIKEHLKSKSQKMYDLLCKLESGSRKDFLAWSDNMPYWRNRYGDRRRKV